MVKKWIDDYLKRSEATVIKSLKKDDFNSSIVRDLIMYEKSTKNRDDILQYLYSKVKTNRGDNRMKKFAIWKRTNKVKGVTLPARFGRLEISFVRRKVPINDAVEEYIKKVYEDKIDIIEESEDKPIKSEKKTIKKEK